MANNIDTLQTASRRPDVDLIMRTVTRMKDRRLFEVESIFSAYWNAVNSAAWPTPGTVAKADCEAFAVWLDNNSI